MQWLAITYCELSTYIYIGKVVLRDFTPIGAATNELTRRSIGAKTEAKFIATIFFLSVVIWLALMDLTGALRNGREIIVRLTTL